jgi:hypothetical protein
VIQIPDPAGKNQLAWAKSVANCLRDLDRRISAILPQRPRSEDSVITSASFKPFQLIVTTDPGDTSVPPAPKIRVVPSTLAGGSSSDLGFSLGDDPEYYLYPSEGVLVGGITWDTSTGAISSRWLEILSEFPDPSGVPDGTDYVEIGTVHWVADDSEAGGHWTATNSRLGPINVQICRDWWAAEPPFFKANWT